MSTRVPRAELIDRCRRQRARLAGMTGRAVQHAHLRDLARVLRIVRRAMRILERR